MRVINVTAAPRTPGRMPNRDLFAVEHFNVELKETGALAIKYRDGTLKALYASGFWQTVTIEEGRHGERVITG